MATVGDKIRPLFPGITLADTDSVTVQRAVPVGPVDGFVRAAIDQVYPDALLADDDWVVVEFAARSLGELASTALLDESFTGTVLNPANWALIEGAVTVSGGRLHFPNVYPQSLIRFTTLFRLTGRTVTMSGMVTPTGPDNSKSRGIRVEVPSYTTNNLVIGKAGVSLSMGVGGQAWTSVLYDPVAHANLRIRQVGAWVYFEASPTGVTWTLLRQVAVPAWVATQDVRCHVYSGPYSASGADAGETTIDGVLIT